MDRRRPPRLSLDLLRGFRAAARYLSFTRASEEARRDGTVALDRSRSRQARRRARSPSLSR